MGSEIKENPGQYYKGLGSLYSVDIDGSITKRLSNVSIANGMAWSMDNKEFYFVDTYSYVVQAFNFDISSGDLSEWLIHLYIYFMKREWFECRRFLCSQRQSDFRSGGWKHHWWSRRHDHRRRRQSVGGVFQQQSRECYFVIPSTYSDLKGAIGFLSLFLTNSPNLRLGSKCILFQRILRFGFAYTQMLKIDPNTGTLLATVEFPAYQVTSAAFGGPKLDELYVTTAGYQLTDEQKSDLPYSGAVFRVTNTGTTGLPGVSVKIHTCPDNVLNSL